MSYPHILSHLKVISFILAIFVLSGIRFAVPVAAQSPTPADNLRAIAHIAAKGADAAQAGDMVAAAAEYDELHTLWASFEDDFRAAQPNAYLEMEDKLHAVRDTLQIAPIPSDELFDAFEALENESAGFAAVDSGNANSSTAPSATPADVRRDLDAISAAINRGDSAAALTALNQVRLAWLSIEGDVATRSTDAYATIETELSRANSALIASPPQLDAAATAIAAAGSALRPFTDTARYSVFDAATIILREGLEALLVLVALLAFLQRSGNRKKRGWVWLGAGAGVAASIGTAFVLQAVFSRAAAGQNREIIEGATGLIAAGLLFYVSYWLHRKSNIVVWKKYLDRQSSEALAQGNLLGLSTLAFLAVFREGAETTVFYLGIASSIALNDLLLGLAIGGGVLAVVAVLMVKLGVKLPLRPFFWVASLLVYYLGFKFLGTGIHALQVARIFPASPIAFLRAIPFIGMYPTWEVVIPQGILLLVGIVVVSLLNKQHHQPMQTA